ncbi:DUF885 domain-containing protein [Brevibacterium otitidis]|uniref:DUF885 domain-containing protein n=1 Tax=Brevibacterium otitidis TaxID=53364 RepID=A0ABV5WZU4_9MICO|nr:DUF885 domain-containing protein [Brevibacterium otitidis]
MTEFSRPRSGIDAVADEYVSQLLDLSPSFRIELGVEGRQDELDDFSPAGTERRAELAKDTLAKLRQAVDAAESMDDTDRVTVDAMNERLGLEIDAVERGYHLGDINVITSPVQLVRDLFDLMPTDTEGDWEHIAAKLAVVPQALDGYRESLTVGREKGRVAAIRQVTEAAKQAEELAKTGGHFDGLVAGASGPEALTAALQDGAEKARAAYGELAQFLRTEIAPHAGSDDACGREEYELASRQFLGAEIDFEETYAWGLEQLAQIHSEQEKVAAQVSPGDDVFAAMKALDADPARQLHGLDALREWMQTTADEAIRELSKEHFDIPEPLHTIECMVLADGTGGIYYTGPSDDFSRPGRMWWSVPAGTETFSTWQEKTTVYHEGVPGHHLQVAQATYLKDQLNDWRRNACWVSGHGEGWALYAERLMADLGFLEDPGDYMGMLDSQRLRAARVCVDLGVHLKLEAPQSVGGGTWDAKKAWQFLTDNVAMDRSFLAFELNRYLGWPGQAPSYKIGQRLWEEIRDEAKQAAGASFSLKDFHARALAVGSVGLDTLRRALV